MDQQPDSPDHPSRESLAGWLRLGLDDWQDDEPDEDDGASLEDLLALGRYRPQEKLGEGGFGEVWAAEQIEPVRRIVALKVLKPGMNSRQVLIRFNQERQTLAMMDHPGIAAIHDAGSTPAGRPYFVMEKVDGRPLTQYCDEKRLSIRARVELFATICQAVHHAHQKGVLHRDLKPSNILVTEIDGRPVPKIIDFGIAKILGGECDIAGNSLLRTREGWILGTPAYVSPEQLMLGEVSLDTRADIYSLGVLLNELLTGRTPLYAAGATSIPMDEWAHRIRNVEAPLPSLTAATAPSEALAARDTASARGLSRQLRGDLDWIVLKALYKDREKRYDSAAAFAKDLRNYLEDLPVAARRPSTISTARKFAKRNRALVIASALSALILVAAAIFSTFAWVKESRMRTQAEAARLEALRLEEEANLQRDRAIASATEAGQQRQRAETTLEYLDELLSRAAKFAAQGSSAEALRLALDEVTLNIPSFTEDTTLRETILGKSAIIYRAIGHEDKAIPLLKAQLEITESKYGPTSPVTLDALNRYARSLSLQNRHDDAVLEAEEIVRRWSSLPQSAAHEHSIFSARKQLADILRRAGRLEEAIAEGAELLASEFSSQSPSWYRFARFYASCLRETGRFEEAAQLLTQSLAAIDPHDDGPAANHMRCVLLQEQSRLQRDQGDPEACTRSLLLGIAAQNKVNHGTSRELPALHVEVSRPLDLQNLNDAAVEHCQRAVEIAIAIDEQPKVLSSTRALAENLENACRFVEAAKAWQDAAALEKKLDWPLHDQLADLAHAVRNLARAGSLPEAMELAAEITERLSDLPQDSSSSSSRKLIRTALAYAQAREFSSAHFPVSGNWRLLLAQMAEVDLQSFENGSGWKSCPQEVQDILHRRRERHESIVENHEPDHVALLAFDRAINDRWLDFDSSGRLFHLAACLRLQGRPDLAFRIYQKVIDSDPSLIRIPGRQTLARLHQASCLVRLNQFAEALSLLHQVKPRVHRDGHLPASPEAFDLLNSLQNHLANME